MKVVALVSGGKDSCYNMMLCHQHDHEVVALANLLPEDDSTNELDSFMYQTVGHQLISAYATCMGLPLFRRCIQGTSKAQGLQYSATEGDEVEDLEVLLSAVKERLPDVQAVSSGAIASDYQRLRVENVCSRLGLVSLAYMWRREQSGLLSDMIASGVRAVLVKVAAMGLEPAKHLGKDLGTMQPVLERLKRLYGCNVCGEGGEYETLTLDCPLFKYARIVIDKSDIIIHSADAFAAVGILHTARFHLESKETGAPLPSNGPQSLAKGGPVATQPQQVSPGAEVIMVEDRASQADSSSRSAEAIQRRCQQSRVKLKLGDPGRETADTPEEASGVTLEVGEVDSHGVARICCEHRTPQTLDAASSSGTAGPIRPELFESAVRALLTATEAKLSTWRMTWADVVYVYLFLADMTHFGQANAAYKSVITEQKCVRGGGVPSRSTVQVGLPPGCAARVEVLVAVGPGGWGTRATENEGGGSGRGVTCIADVAGPLSGDTSGLGRGRNAPKLGVSTGNEPGEALRGGTTEHVTDKSGSQNGASLCGAASDMSGSREGLGTTGERFGVNGLGKEAGERDGGAVSASEGGPLEGTGEEVGQTERTQAEAGRMEETAVERDEATERTVEVGTTAGTAAEGGKREEVVSEGRREGLPEKKVLHVQSISSWAPSCIGPYSQATAYNGRLYMAGQLGLDPGTMELVPGGAGTQMARALVSCEAVAQAMNTSARLTGEILTVYYDKQCTEDDLWALREELDLFLKARPSARYTDSFNRETSEAADPSPVPARRDLRLEVAREMVAEMEGDVGKSGWAMNTDEDACVRQPEIKYEDVPALPKNALVEVVMVCRVS